MQEQESKSNLMEQCTLSHAMSRVIEQGAEQGLSFYALLRRQAGWAVQWHEESRCMTTPPTVMSEAVLVSGGQSLATTLATHAYANRARREEGLWVRGYHPTAEEALTAELLALATKQEESSTKDSQGSTQPVDPPGR